MLSWPNNSLPSRTWKLNSLVSRSKTMVQPWVTLLWGSPHWVRLPGALKHAPIYKLTVVIAFSPTETRPSRHGNRTRVPMLSSTTRCLPNYHSCVEYNMIHWTLMLTHKHAQCRSMHSAGPALPLCRCSGGAPHFPHCSRVHAYAPSHPLYARVQFSSILFSLKNMTLHWHSDLKCDMSKNSICNF